MLQTIIFIRMFTKYGYEISGYIDYTDRLMNEDWTGIFTGVKRVTPRITDLSYYHWRSNKSYTTATPNFDVSILRLDWSEESYIEDHRLELLSLEK
jgi:hypothetical protein